MQKKQVVIEQLRKLGVYNSSNFCTAGSGKVSIAYIPQDTGRGGHGSMWRIHGNGFNTDPKAHWMDYGNKTLSCHRDNRAERLEEAKMWAAERYGITEWKRDVFGGWQDKRVWDKVMQESSGYSPEEEK